MKIVRIEGAAGTVTSGNLRKTVDLSLMRDVGVGDYVLVHAGFAIEKIKKAEAEKTLRALKDIG